VSALLCPTALTKLVGLGAICEWIDLAFLFRIKFGFKLNSCINYVDRVL